jgi:hypothetical protein
MLATWIAAGASIVPSNLCADQAAAKPVQQTTEAKAPLTRWLDISAASVSARYRFVRDGNDRTRLNQLQTQQIGRFRLKLDQAAKYAIHLRLQSGNTFTGSWNNTGVGTGTPRAAVLVRDLYGSMQPLAGMEAQYGGIGIARGENSEITSYDNDGYLTGGRLSVRRRATFFFDEISVTIAYLGDVTTPNVFRRFKRLNEVNYHQVLVARHFGARLAASTDYTDAPDADALRQGIRVLLGSRWLDAIRIEYGIKTDGPTRDYAVATTAEKHIAKNVLITGGWSDVRPGLAMLNADRYGSGQRLFTIGSVPLGGDLTASWAVLRELDAPASSSDKIRVDAMVTWNLLRTLQRAGVVH